MSACRPCTFAAAIGFARDVCKQEKMEIESLEKVFTDGYENEEVVKNALDEFVQKVPEERKTEAEAIMCFAFAEHTDCRLDNKNK